MSGSALYASIKMKAVSYVRRAGWLPRVGSLMQLSCLSEALAVDIQ